MCGIIGYLGGETREGDWQGTHSLLSELLVQAVSRGRDATGFAALAAPLDHPFNQKIVTAKEPLPAGEFIAHNPFWRQLRHRRCISVIGHVRAATHGEPSDNRNNHPFYGKVGNSSFALVHNGIITNAREVADRFSFPMESECDSEVAKGLIEATGSFPEGLYRCLTELEGSMALAVMDYRTGTLWLARDAQRPLWVCRLADKRRIIIASTAEIICRAVEKKLGKFADMVESLHPLAAGYVHALTIDGRLIAPYTAPARLATSLPTG